MTKGSGLIVVRTFSKPHEAHLACSALHAAGIQATLADEHIVAADWLYSNAVGGVKVLVRIEDAETARAVLATPAQIDADAMVAEDRTTPVAEVDACPRCGSRNVAAIAPGRRLLFLSWLVVGIPIVPVLRRTRCRDCGYRFRIPRATA